MPRYTIKLDPLTAKIDEELPPPEPSCFGATVLLIVIVGTLVWLAYQAYLVI